MLYPIELGVRAAGGDPDRASESIPTRRGDCKPATLTAEALFILVEGQPFALHALFPEFGARFATPGGVACGNGPSPMQPGRFAALPHGFVFAEGGFSRWPD